MSDNAKARTGAHRVALITAIALMAASGCGREEEKPKHVHKPPTPAQRLEARVRANPADLEARAALGNFYFDEEYPHLAIPQYLEILKHRPHDPNVRTDLGTCYKRLGALAQAKVEFGRALESQPGHVNANFNLAVVHYLTGDYELAAQGWDRVASLAPGTPTAEVALKQAAEAREKLAEAARAGEESHEPKVEQREE